MKLKQNAGVQLIRIKQLYVYYKLPNFFRTMKALSLQIQTVVFNIQENNTCYFQNPLRLLKCFQNYLHSLQAFQPHLRVNSQKENLQQQTIKIVFAAQNIKIFSQKLSVKQLVQYPLSLQILQIFRFINLKSISLHSSSQANIQQSIRLIEVIFVIYIVCEYKRYKLFQQAPDLNDKKKHILFNEAQNDMKEAQQFIKKLSFRYNFQTKNKKLFDINQEKFLKLLLIKSLEMKLQKQKSNSKKVQDNSKNHKIYHQELKQHIQNSKDKKNQSKMIIKNESFMTIKSQYFDEEHKSMLFSKQYQINQEKNINFQLQFQELDQQDLFEYISLDI